MVKGSTNYIRNIHVHVNNKHMLFNPWNAQLFPICHLLALLVAHHILHFSRIRVNNTWERTLQDTLECSEFWQTTCYSLARHEHAPTENIKSSNKNNSSWNAETTAINPITADSKGKLKNKNKQINKNTSTVKLQIPHKKTATNNMNALCGNTSKSPDSCKQQGLKDAWQIWASEYNSQSRCHSFRTLHKHQNTSNWRADRVLTALIQANPLGTRKLTWRPSHTTVFISTLLYCTHPTPKTTNHRYSGEGRLPGSNSAIITKC
jgi:hypothetical protein